MFPWLSNIEARTANQTVVTGVSHGTLSLTVTGNTTVCVVAASDLPPPVFVPPVAVLLDGGRIVVPINSSLSNDTVVCGALPPLSVLCNGDSECDARGTLCMTGSGLCV